MIFSSKPVPGCATGLEKDNIHTTFREGVSGWLLLQLVCSYLTPKYFMYRCEGFLYWFRNSMVSVTAPEALEFMQCVMVMVLN